VHYKGERAGDVDDEEQSRRLSLLDDIARRERGVVVDLGIGVSV